jgi:hypothetical protein
MKYILYKMTFPNDKIYLGIATRNLKDGKRKHFTPVELDSTNRRIKAKSTYKNYIFKFVGEPNVT